MTLIKDLIEIPEQVHQGDFVLELSKGVNRAEKTLADYVVTPQLRKCFDDALGFIQSALRDRTSKASYLHGSFGSGKSHFMAVLHLLLQGDLGARSIPELAPVVSKHNEWVQGKKFLLVPYHMLGAQNMESGILGGYVNHIRQALPEAPIPGVYLAEGLLEDAWKLRRSMGDDAFFAGLEASDEDGGEDDWGTLGRAWSAERFESAASEPPGGDERSRLVGDLTKSYFRSYANQMESRSGEFVSLDKGLAILSRHAAGLGYDGLILFLDELILWLAGHAVDLKFVHQEGQKLAKLVEAQSADRPIPIVSFVARQRDLRELIGDSVPGADRLNFGDALKHWEGRFHRINLEDRNLPAIAEKRVLKPKSETARAELDAAFEQTRAIREGVMNVLLTREGDRAMFRQVYPFSPALIQTLIAVSSVLQRERTALKVMLQLLVDQRETLRVGDIVPVGDLFDIVAQGDEAFSPEMARHFDNAKKLYQQKLLPLLEKTHGPLDEIEAAPADDPKRLAFRNDDRLIKTLLLAALVPEVESLRALNAERLAALNHGTIRSPIPGREGQEVLRRCRRWAAAVGEIRIGEEPQNPSISIQLSGVDTESIIAQAAREDSHGNRIRRAREMIFERIGVEDEGGLERRYEFVWRNTKRSCVILFNNIRELSDASLDNDPDDAADWKLVIDFPFDEQGRGPRDDLSRLAEFREARPSGAKTICWVPSFFSDDAQRDLGLLVKLEHILTGERFGQYSNHLSPQDRQSAKQILESQRSVLNERVKSHLDAAYGLEGPARGSIDPARELEPNERFVSLRHGFEPAPPPAQSLAGALLGLMSQALEHEFPAAPEFEAEPRGANLRRVFEVVGEAAQNPDGRVLVDRTLRSLVRGIANPLRLGEMGHDSTHFVLGQFWRTHFTKKAAETGAGMEVARLRKWIDEPKPMGLAREVQNLVILTFAQQTNRSFLLHRGPFEPSLADLRDDCELREQKLPDEAKWRVAVDRAGAIFGVSVSSLLNAINAANLASKVRDKANDARGSVQSYAQKLGERAKSLKIEPNDNQRLATAWAASNLVKRLQEAPEEAVVDAIASAEIATSEAAMGECVAKAETLQNAIGPDVWRIFEAAWSLADDRQTVAKEIRAQVVEALRLDEHARPLAPTLAEAHAKALRLLTKTPKTPPGGGNGETGGNGGTSKTIAKPGRKVVAEGEDQFNTIREARARLDEIASTAIDGRSLRVTISWRVEEVESPEEAAR